MIFILSLAMIFDGVIGEPNWIYSRIKHPVTWMAALLMSGEQVLNKPVFSSKLKYLLGFLWVSVCIIICIIFSYSLQYFVQVWDSSGILLALIASVFLAFRSLLDHVSAIEKALNNEKIEEARKALNKIVGRDTQNLDVSGVTRAAIESLSENFSDGVLAPAFWFLVGGLPGIATYKMINTADSMIGNRTARFNEFGWASAKIDDAVNFIPARITALVFILLAGFSKLGDAKFGWHILFRDNRLHASPNAGWPEAAMAGILRVKLGGPRDYDNGNVKDSAWLGSGDDILTDDLTRALKIIKISWVIIVLMLWGGNLV